MNYLTEIQDSGDPNYTTRLLIGTATTGVVRMEWVQGRYGQIIPTNWGMVQMLQFINAYIPLRYQVADAQNLIVHQAVLGNYEWLFLLEHDVILPPDGFIQVNEYMRSKEIPIVSGLYYTRSRPSEPILYRGRGNSYVTDWNFGDKVWVDGVPTGCLLIHMSILREMWKDSPEYDLYGQKIKRVFRTPMDVWADPESGQFNTKSGTSDLEWCTAVMEGGYFQKAGWGKFHNLDWPFLVDTNLLCKHIDLSGEQFP